MKFPSDIWWQGFGSKGTGYLLKIVKGSHPYWKIQTSGLAIVEEEGQPIEVTRELSVK